MSIVEIALKRPYTVVASLNGMTAAPLRSAWASDQRTKNVSAATSAKKLVAHLYIKPRGTTPRCQPIVLSSRT
jgi:hypothetical protein